MSQIYLCDSDAISNRLRNVAQDIESFFISGITHDFSTDFREFCNYINIDTSLIDIQYNPKSKQNQNENHFLTEFPEEDENSNNSYLLNLIEFRFKTEINAGMVEFLSIIFSQMIDPGTTKISILIPEKQLRNKSIFQMLHNLQVKFQKCFCSLIVYCDGPLQEREHIHDILYGWPALRVLSLKNTSITDNDCFAINEKFKNENQNERKGRKIQKSESAERMEFKRQALILDFNDISDAGFEQLLQMIPYMPELIILSMAYNTLTDQSLNTLQILLEENNYQSFQNLKQLNLAFNHFSKEKKQEFISFLSEKQESFHCKVIL